MKKWNANGYCFVEIDKKVYVEVNKVIDKLNYISMTLDADKIDFNRTWGVSAPRGGKL